MAVYQHPDAPKGRVMIRGVEFIDGTSADVEVSEDTLTLFTAYGITASAQPTTGTPSKAELQATAAELGLDATGTKAELSARIVEHQADTKE